MNKSEDVLQRRCNLVKAFRSTFVVLPLALGLLLIGCASPLRSEPVVQTTPQPSEQSLEMIRALTQLNELKEELKLLRNSVEEMQFNQENADRRQQDLFKDIDGRLLGLERNEQQLQAQLQSQTEQPTTPSAEVLAQGQTGFENINTRGGQSESQQINSVIVVETQNRSIPEAGSSSQSTTTSVSLTEQEAYDAAFEMLKQSRYQDAVEQFQSMANTWPDSQLADDAYYWMSEANYVNREFEAALNGFRTIVERYPDSSRLPEAMLKVGYIQYDIGAYDQAANTFRDIIARFPGHQVTIPAETRLRRIEQTIQ